MSSSNLMRWSGLAALVGGGLFAIVNVVESLLLGNQLYSEAAATGAWIIIQGAYLVAAMLIGLGLIGLYVRQAEQAGTLGLIAFLVTFIGGMMATGSTWSEAFFGAWLAKAAPELLDADPTGVVIAGAILSLLLFALGWFLLGLVSLRAAVLPRGASILLMVGALLFAVINVMDLPFAGVLFGAGLVWRGYGLWSGAAHEPELMAQAAT
jgi:hypothetical protein